MKEQDKRAVESMCRCGLNLEGVIAVFPTLPKEDVMAIYNSVKGLETNKGYGNSLSATDVTEEIFWAACQIFDKLWDKKMPIRQIGVHTSRVQTDAGRQYNLFDLQKFDRLEILDRTIDEIRKKYGEDAVLRASFLRGNVSHMGGGLDKERRFGITIGIDVDHEKTRII